MHENNCAAIFLIVDELRSRVILAVLRAISDLYRSWGIYLRFYKLCVGHSEISCKPVFYRTEWSGTRISEKYITHQLQVNCISFWWFFSLILSLRIFQTWKQKKIIITKFRFSMRIIRHRVSKYFVIFMFYTINRAFQNTFQIVRKPILRFFGYKNFYETNGLYEALRYYKFFSNFHFTDQILCRSELQKIQMSFFR